MPNILRIGSEYNIFDSNDIEICHSLPAKTYVVEQHPMSKKFSLKPISDFDIPTKLYGNIEKNASRILDTFESRKGTTGVLLNGVKGSGKTLLAKYISHLAKNKNYPTIVINKNYFGDEFNQFIQSIEVPTIILFDEFEKIYNWNDQEKILTLLDGVYSSKKLFVLTSNEERHINSFLKNRPGRIYYSLSFSVLEPDFVKEYCEDNLNNKTHIPSIVRYVQIYNFFNFDMLQAVVEEMNRYNESLSESLKMLNIVPEVKNDNYIITFVINNQSIVLQNQYNDFDPDEFVYDVPRNDIEKLISSDEKVEEIFDSHKNDFDEITFNASHLVGFDPTTQKFIFEKMQNGKKVQLICEKNKEQFKFNYQNLLV